MKNSTLNPLDQLAKLTTQRTARTDRLHSAVRNLTDALESSGARPGEINVTVDGWTLTYDNLRSNVGQRDCWSWYPCDESLGYCTDLGFPVDHDGYLHGDFNCPTQGPSRAHLIAFGQRAARLVAMIVAKVSAESEAASSAADSVSAVVDTL
jgi:hypothetical protein